MKRQRGRNRKPNNNANNANPNRSWDSQGPENIKVRGNAQTVYERYQQLARDASSGGDRVLAENYMQHAEHYFRVLRALQPQRPVSEIAARELSNQGFDIDFEDETGAQAAAFLAAQQAADRAAQGQVQQGEGQGGEQRPYRDRDQNQNQNREWRDREPREPREAREPREDTGEPRAEGEGGRRETRRERWERRQQERNRRFEGESQGSDAETNAAESVVEAQSEPPVVEAVVETPAADTPRPVRARRPRTTVETPTSEDDSPMALPGFLTRAPSPAVAASEDSGEEPAPRRRAPRRKIEAPADSDG